MATKSHLGPAEVVYKTVSDCKISVDIYVPGQVKAPASVPTIMFVHGGAFVLGHARMNSALQIQDCLDRGWIVVAPNHRLCPQVDMLEGPIKDCQDLWKWILEGKLDQEITKMGAEGITSDTKKFISMGTSAGGNVAYSLTYAGMPSKPAAVIDFYGAKNFQHSFWTSPLPHVKAPPLLPGMTEEVYNEQPVATKGGPVSLEGQKTPQGPPPPNARVAFALNGVKEGKSLENIFPAGLRDPSRFKDVDPILNIGPGHPPTCIVHGKEDVLIPIEHSLATYAELERHGIPCKMIQVEGEGHTFAGAMELGTNTWNTQRQAFDWAAEVIS